MKQQYRAEQVGSLLRPAELLEARVALADGRIAAEALRAVEDRAIEDALRRQRDIGLDILSDGEMRRGSWLTDMADAVEGFTESRCCSSGEVPAAPPKRRPRGWPRRSCARRDTWRRTRCRS